MDYDRDSGLTYENMQGCSGGPLIDADGAVVGVLSKGGADEGRAWTVANPVSSIRRTLAAALTR